MKQCIILLAMGSIVGIASADVITVHNDRPSYEAAVGVPQIVEDFTPTSHFPLVSGVLNSLTTDAGLNPGDIEEGVTYSTPIGEGNFFNIDAGGGYDGGFLDGFNPSDRDVTIVFHNSDPNDLRTVNGFGMEFSGALGSVSVDVTISFSTGPDQLFNVVYDAGFVGFTSDVRDITGAVVSNTDGFFGFDFDNFTYDVIPEGPCLDMTVSTLVAGQTGIWDIAGADGGSTGVVAWGTVLGQTVVNGTFGYCATFGINGVAQNRVVGFWSADGNGDAQVQRRIPGGVSGITVHTQAAQQGTCPEECMSDVDTQTIG